MAYKYDPTIEPNIKALIVSLTNIKQETPMFNYIHDYFMKTLRRSDSAFFITKTEIDTKVEGLAEKLIFHGYLKESQMFKTVYNKYINTSANDDDLKNKMAIVELLFALSRSPTAYLASLPEGHILPEEEKDENIDWGAYLMEGIDDWKPNFDETEDESTDEELSPSPVEDEENTITQTVIKANLPNLQFVTSTENTITDNFASCRKLLTENVQSKWFVSNVVRQVPDVDDPEADIAIRWEQYLSQVSHGLLGGPRTKLLTEYKVLREIIWQLMAPHNSVVFCWRGNRLIVNDDVSIPSLRPIMFKNLVSTFIPNIMMLHELRTFQQRVMSDERAPHTYCGYAEAAMSIVQPVIQRIVEIEAEIANQETTFTLISLGNNLKRLFKNIQYLHRVHRAAILDYTSKPRHTCCIHLLTTLYKELNSVYDKYQMDIILTLYLDASYKYIRIIEEWFRTDRLIDLRREFPFGFNMADQALDADLQHENVIQQTQYNNAIDGVGIGKKAAFERATYVLRQITDDEDDEALKFDNDPFMSLIKKEVLQIGRQLRLFSLLGKLYLLHGTNFSIYDEWKLSICETLKIYTDICDGGTVICSDIDDELIDEGIAPSEASQDEDLVQPGVLNIEGKYSTEFDLLEHVADTSDGLLMSAFQDIFYPTESKVKARSQSTYNELVTICTKTIPGIQVIIAESLEDIIRKKYRNCGKVLKDLFLRDHNLAEHINIMGKIFLFAEDAIFPFYRAIFAKIESNASWGNDIWLTYDLQDVLHDQHPKLHERVRVGVRSGWVSMLEDPLRTCTLIDVQYAVEWPIDIIVTERCAKMYREMFYFILKIKWALHTLNHMRYSRVEQKRRHNAPKYVKVFLQRLEILRFGYINVFSALQHYVLGYVYKVCKGRFDREFTAATDLESLVKSHEDFVFGFHRLVARVRDYQDKAFGFDRALYSVRHLRKMWLSPGDVSDKTLKKTEDSLLECHRNIFDVISVQIYD